MSEQLNRIVIEHTPCGGIKVIKSDQPIEVYNVSDHLPNDRVYQWREGVGLLVGTDLVDDALGDSPIGHYLDYREGKHSPRGKTRAS
jgi:hypothetical protein